MATPLPSSGIHSTTSDSLGSDNDIAELAARHRIIRKRLPAEEGGYACPSPGCERIFDRKSELTKHEKYHLPKEDRPFRCEACSKRFLFQKDLRRHEKLHMGSQGAEHSSPSIRLSSRPLSPVAQNQNGDHDLQKPRPVSLEPIGYKDDHANGVGLNSATTMSNSSTFRYQRLSAQKEIRLLAIHPGQAAESLQCTLTCVNLEADPPPEYEALSYLWGDIEDSRSLLINGRTMRVRSNLYSALTELRKTNQVRNMWVDAVCINQNDLEERSNQVSIMREIFESATQVCVWLGEGNHDSQLAYSFIKTTISNMFMVEGAASNPRFAPQWKALASLMNNPWFSRRWVVQEISFAKSATLYCGSDYLPWPDFAIAVSLLVRHQDQISKIFRASEDAEFDSNFLGDVQAMGAARIVRATFDLFYRNDEKKIVGYKYLLSDLIPELSGLEVVDRHDHIYAVLSLAKDTHHRITSVTKSWTSAFSKTGKRGLSAVQEPDAAYEDNIAEPRAKRTRVDGYESNILLSGAEKWLAKSVVNVFRKNVADRKRKQRIYEIDYNQPLLEVYKQFLDYAFAFVPGTNNLDILCKPWAPKSGGTTLPSWITTIADASFETRQAEFAPGGQQIARKNPDSLVLGSSAANPGRSIYNACSSRRATEWRFGDNKRGESELSLFVSGLMLDEIIKIEAFSQYGNIPAEWFEFAGWHPWDSNGNKISETRPPEQLWRTLVADRDSDGSNPQAYFPKAFEYAIECSTPTTGVETTTLMRRSNPILLEFLKRMSAVVWNRKLFRTHQHVDLLGLAPKKAKEGDVICILKGCSVPVVLREHRQGGHSHFEFIGPCYLHTMMDGRAIDVQEEKNIPMQEFELR